MRCLYCGKRLAILRKLTDSEFCTGLHRRLYHQEQEKMGLARLMDVQKRFSGFTAQGTPDPAPQNGKSAPKPDPAPAPVETPRELIKRFLPYFPLARALQGFLPIPATPLAQMMDSFLPEYRFTWLASPYKAGGIPIPGCQSKPPAFAPRLLHPESLPFERSTAYQNPPIFCNSPGFAVSKECAWSWAQPRGTAATRLLPSLKLVFSGLAPVRPILLFHQLLSLPATPLAVSP